MSNATASGDSRTRRWQRRAVSFSAVAVLALVVFALLPLLLALALAVDLLRRSRLAASRTVLALTAYLIAEVVGLVVAGLYWLGSFFVSSARYQGWNHQLQLAWVSSLMRVTLWAFSMRISVVGEQHLLPGPILLFVRHASVIDTLLAATFVSRGSGLFLRYVLKSELLWEPCLDVVGHRLPNVFVRRSSGEAAAEIARVGGLAAGLGSADGVLIYPEGTRFTRAKRQKLLGKLGPGEAAARARVERFHHVLPPRPGGALALIEACEADVVILCHSGFEGVERLDDLFAGALIGREVRIEFFRVPRSAIPASGRAEWLDEQWLHVDAWVGRQLDRDSESA